MVTLAILLRLVQGVGAGMFVTAAYAMLPQLFPDHISTMVVRLYYEFTCCCVQLVYTYVYIPRGGSRIWNGMDLGTGLDLDLGLERGGSRNGVDLGFGTRFTLFQILVPPLDSSQILVPP